uniref:Tyrosine-protein phosphatase non-receptor type 9 n=1 Tax=Ascaris suum TaxID=6253 RepID=F1L4P0_ASCSU
MEKLIRKAHKLVSAKDHNSDKDKEALLAKKKESKRKNKHKQHDGSKFKCGWREKKRREKTLTHIDAIKPEVMEREKYKTKAKKSMIIKSMECETEEREFTEDAIKGKENEVQKRLKRDMKTQEAVNKWVETTLKKGVEGLKRDFEIVKRLIPNPLETIIFEANQVTGRNRFKDVPCLDETRVVLVDDPLNNYIHANYVRMALMERPIICTQAPLDLTVYHFYQMIMHENVTIIIMLCNFTESGRKVCNEYYPLTKKDAALMFGDITVICLRRFVMQREPTVYFTLLGLKNNSGKQQVVRHIQWSDWPENGVPDVSMTPMSIFSTVRGSKGPVVVHCIDGVSRTGTIVAIEFILEKMLCGEASENSAEMIKELRKQRALCVRNETQYIYIHREILEYLQNHQVIDMGQELSEFIDDYERMLNKETNKAETSPSFDANKAMNMNDAKTPQLDQLEDVESFDAPLKTSCCVNVKDGFLSTDSQSKTS